MQPSGILERRGWGGAAVTFRVALDLEVLEHSDPDQVPLSHRAPPRARTASFSRVNIFTARKYLIIAPRAMPTCQEQTRFSCACVCETVYVCLKKLAVSWPPVEPL